MSSSSGSSQASTEAAVAGPAFAFKRSYTGESLHPVSDSDDEEQECSASVLPPQSKKARHLPASECDQKTGISSTAGDPCATGLYLTKVNGIRNESYEEAGFTAYCLTDILREHSGKLVESIQFNYMFEIDWLVQQYPVEFRSAPVTLVHGNQGPGKADLDVKAMRHRQVKLVQARLDMPYGTHHSKMMLLLYSDGLRVVIHTANMIERDWHQKTQCGWISPLLPPLCSSSGSNNSAVPAATAGGDSTTGFRSDLLRYLRYYRHPRVTRWAEVVEQHDFSAVRVFLVASCPGRHSGDIINEFGHLKLRRTLRQFNFDSPSGFSSLIAQFSSIGSLGANPEAWLTGELLASLSAGGRLSLHSAGNSALKLIYPTKDNVRLSLEGFPAGGSLPYRNSVARQQKWLNSFMHSWSANRSGRSRAMPHMKSYMRAIDRDCESIQWYLVTSANLSKAAWGCLEKSGSQLMIRSYEIGVLFVAKQFGLDAFLSHYPANAAASPGLPVPYDLPPNPYAKTDKPWVLDLEYSDMPDTHGNIWCPTV